MSMILRRVETDADGLQLQVGHYRPVGSWECLEAHPDSDGHFEVCLDVMSRLNGGSDKFMAMAAAALPGLLLRNKHTDYSWTTAKSEDVRKIADRAYDLASEIEFVVRG